MGKRNSKGGSKKGKSKNSREKKNESNLSKQQENSQKSTSEYVEETIIESNEEQNETSYTNSAESTAEASNKSNTENESKTNCDNTNECYEEIKAKQEELLNNLKDLSNSLVNLTLIRDDVNSLRVDTLTEIYFTRQVRPLLDALNIISFSVNNMTTGAINIQNNTFGDRKEIRHALNLSYKMNDEVEDIINALGRRLKIFVKQIDDMDKNCQPFNFNKDS